MAGLWRWLSLMVLVVAGAVIAYMLWPKPLPEGDLRRKARELAWSRGAPWSAGFHYWLGEAELLVQGRNRVERVDARDGSRVEVAGLRPLAVGAGRAVGELRADAAEGMALWTPLRGGVGFAALDGSLLQQRPCTKGRRCGFVWLGRGRWLEFALPPGGGAITKGFLHSLRAGGKPRPIALPGVPRGLLESAMPREDNTLLLAADAGEMRACVALLDVSKSPARLRWIKRGDMEAMPALLALPAPGGRRLAWAYARPEPEDHSVLARGLRHRWTAHVLLDPMDGGPARLLGTYPLRAATPCCPGLRIRWLPDARRMSFACEERLWIVEVP